MVATAVSSLMAPETVMAGTSGASAASTASAGSSRWSTTTCPVSVALRRSPCSPRRPPTCPPSPPAPSTTSSRTTSRAWHRPCGAPSRAPSCAVSSGAPPSRPGRPCTPSSIRPRRSSTSARAASSCTSMRPPSASGGGPPAEAVGQEIWDWTPMVDEQRWGELWRAASQRPIVDFEATLHLAGGEERLISATLDHHARDEDSFVIVYARDITEQREVEERAAESEALYRRIVEMASEGIWAMDGEDRTTFVNPQMAAMLGYEPDEMLGRAPSDFMFEEDLVDFDARMRERREGQPGHYQRRFRRKDGGEVWTSASLTSESGPEGEYLGSFGMFTDVTEMRAAAEEVQT